MRKLTLILLAFILVASACSDSDTDPTAVEPRQPAVDLDDDEIRLLAGLVPFDDCNDLLDHLKNEARERVGPYGLDYFGYGYFDDVVFATEDEAAEAAGDDGGDGGERAVAEPAAEFDSAASDSAQGGGTGGDGDFTGTNVQEAGVDEPDIIKTDGDRILVVSDNVLSYVEAGDDPRTRDTLRLPEGWGHELFFQGDRALLFTNGGSWGHPIAVEPALAEGDAEAEFAEDVEPFAPEPGPGPEWYGPSAAIFEIDLSDPDDLEIVATLRIQGQYLSARRVGDTVRMALTSPPSQLEWVYPSTPAGEDRAERFNRELIDETVIEDWIPEYELTTDAGTERGALLDCNALHKPADFSGFDVVSVLSFGIDGGLDRGSGAGVLASGQTVYASTDRFYIATTEWVGEEIVDGDFVAWNETFTTDIHAFAISTDEPAQYVASGMVDGSLLNQFSMDEHEGYLRIITTEGSPWNERDLSETGLTVLKEEGDVLTQVGFVGGLGKGESLFSARLMDDIGFAVTFEQIDPFYVLDLSDPENPQVTGELKIPGFSTYLHPVGGRYVLGVGQDATDTGRTTGLKVSLFDVSDPADPLEVDVWTLPNANSPVEWDHRAFQFLADQNLAIIPFTNWSGDGDGAVLLRVDDAQLIEVGTVSHQPDDAEPTSDCDVIDTSSLTEETELFWMAQEGGRVQFCDENDKGGYSGWYCDAFPVDELRFWGPEEVMQPLIDDITGGDVGPEDRIEICWPDGGNWRLQIQRSLVIGDTLWTMSPAQLQANDLGSLEVGPIVSLS